MVEVDNAMLEILTEAAHIHIVGGGGIVLHPLVQRAGDFQARLCERGPHVRLLVPAAGHQIVELVPALLWQLRAQTLRHTADDLTARQMRVGRRA